MAAVSIENGLGGKQARNQMYETNLYERRAQIIAELYGMLVDLEDAFRKWIVLDIDEAIADPESKQDEWNEYQRLSKAVQDRILETV